LEKEEDASMILLAKEFRGFVDNNFMTKKNDVGVVRYLAKNCCSTVTNVRIMKVFLTLLQNMQEDTTMYENFNLFADKFNNKKTLVVMDEVVFLAPPGFVELLLANYIL
jgi:hypothetical protein